MSKPRTRTLRAAASVEEVHEAAARAAGIVRLVSRKGMYWKIPFGVLDDVDRLRGKRDRTSVVVEALESWIRAEQRRKAKP